MDHFIDEVTVELQAGKGGNGCVSFRREKYVPFGGPNGGDGGDGGSIYVIGDASIQTLGRFKESFYYKAPKGTHGQGKNLYGRKGEDIILHVPIGTVVYEKESGKILADVKDTEHKFLLAKGGKGGRGNVHFKTSTRKAPEIAENGEEGQVLRVFMELKILADVGLVGFPNAGKSTLIRAISNSSSEVAAYPFSTLRPFLGVVKWQDWKTFIVADIPGIIKGSSEGKGKGLKFLKHIERSKIYLFVIDIFGEEKPSAVFFTLRQELESYNAALLDRPYFVVLNKADSLENKEEGDKVLKEFLEETKLPDGKAFVISALKKNGLEPLIQTLGEETQKESFHEPLKKELEEDLLEKDWKNSFL